MNRDYCACIRTLGKAGEKYQTLLDSLKHQTIQPKKILVYIPDGYDLPKETIGIEQYIRCEKGMVHQRSLPFDEVDTEWILFLDDDLYIPEDGIEKLFIGLEENQGDCISPDIYEHTKFNSKTKLKAALFSFTLPHFKRDWAFRVTRYGGYTYNNSPSKSVLLSQSAAGACYLIRKKVYQSIHFEDESWMDQFRYSIGDDLLFSYKIFLGGFRQLVHYNTGLIHLDAQSGRVQDNKERYFMGQFALTVVWYRACYNIKHADRRCDFLTIASYVLVSIWKFVFGAVLRSCKYHSLNSMKDFIMAKIHAYRYVHSDEYSTLPFFDEYENEAEKLCP